MDTETYFFLNTKIYEKKINFLTVTLTVLGISYKRKQTGRVCRLLHQNKLIVFVDHNLGGGANVYFEIEKEGLLQEGCILRVRYLPHRCNFRCELYAEKECHYLELESYDALESFLASLTPSRIIISELVSYDTLRMLDILKRVKRKSELTFLCHDYHACCPSFTLMDCSEEYCGANTDMQRCRTCFSGLRLAQDDWANNILLSGAYSVEVWRRAFAEFFTYVDRVVVFDSSVADIFCKYYPHIQSKIEVKPHTVPQLRTIRYGTEKTMVAFLGNISSISKGSLVLQYLDEHRDQWGEMNFILVGECCIPLKNIQVLGKYHREKLPDILEYYEVNCIFIPSMCPETFSYTTAEAMLMGLPIACFDMGAPAHRVATYTKGLILDRTQFEYICPSLSEFMNQLKRGK